LKIIASAAYISWVTRPALARTPFSRARAYPQSFARSPDTNPEVRFKRFFLMDSV
jgi:hypothetical protein